MYAGNGAPSLSSAGMNSYNEDTPMMAASDVYIPPPSYSGVGHGQGTSHNQIHDTTTSRQLAQTVEEKKAPSLTAFGRGQGNSDTRDGNAIHDQAPSLGAMTRVNVSQPSSDVDPYSGDKAAPSRGALNKRELSQNGGSSGGV